MTNRTGITMGGNPITLIGTEAVVGEKGTNFTVVDFSLKPVTLDDFAGKIKIISVVPSIDTGVCALQTKRFEAEAAKLEDTVVLTISVDLPFAQKRFAGENSIENNHLLSDYQTHDFGVEYGFEIEGLALLSRGIVVLDRDNVIRYVEYVKEVTTEPDYDAALAVAKSL
ncbi:thiol peroxidase [Ignatzschineria cameli]|uniref:Thiol peroxidase n=1 Tax=Ignatzschineria cameli TaxID=2182793 RepID=A0A2U2ATZ8_9GAMM|nr:thiol peroxidase [Ignatzschineria cameli]PWD88181.1 thiol peroxidase [Ignatzschineria cameli]PWD91210.1 thiol peroxidase [Ignatzschineria cameli]PWD92851.1 thiol peroxidase [Ignatzschineria cameli]PWD93872.1 thiol peroxidase [Ignatzschineria cameli]